MRPRFRLPLLSAAMILLSAGAAAAQTPRRDPLPPLSPEKRTLLQRSDSLSFVRQPKEVIALLTPAIEAAREEGDSTYLLQLLFRLGQERVAYGAGAAGEEPLREALRLADRQHDTRARLRALRWLSVAASNQGRHREARLLADSLLLTARREQDLFFEAWARIGIGWDEDIHGRSEEAIREYRHAIDNLERLQDAWSASWAQNSLGVAQGHLGRYAEAMRSYARAAELAQSVGHAMVEAMARNNLGTLAYSLGDPGQAVTEFRRAREIHLRVGNPREAAYPVINEANCLFRLGREDRALVLVDSLLAVARAEKYPDLLVRLLADRALLSSQRGRPREAAAHYREALSLGDDLPNKRRLEAAMGLAEQLAELDSARAGIDLLQRTAAVCPLPRYNDTWLEFEALLGRLQIEAARGERTSTEEGLARLLAVVRAADSLGLQGVRVRNLSAAAGACRALGRPEDARRHLEEAAAAWEAERSVPLDPEWREVRGAAGREISTELADLLTIEGIEPAFERLQEFKARTLRERLRGPGEQAPGGNSETPSDGSMIERLTAARLQRETLRPGELFLDLYGGPRVSFLFAVTRDSLRMVRLPGEEELRPTVRTLHELLTTSPGEASTAPEDSSSGAAVLAAAQHLERDLLGEVRDLLDPAARVLVSPDGIFHLLPWETYADASWSRVPSAGLLATLREASTPLEARARVRYLAAYGADGEAPTTGSRAEVRWLRRWLWGTAPARFRAEPPATKSGEKAGESSSDGPVLPLRPEDQVLHVAGHITISDQNPWQSEIRLGSGPAERLRARGIADLDLPVRLVVLSGCSSAGGRILSGEGVPGLASACLAAGARAVVASLWPVEDAAAARLVAAFYQGLTVGESVDTALASARADLRRDPATRHPFYWASFVAIGDGAVAVPLRPRPRWLIPAMAAGGVLLAAVLLFSPRWRRR